MGPHLSSIKYMYSSVDTAEVQVLKATSEGHLTGLRRLFVTNNQAKGWRVLQEHFIKHSKVLPTACPHLEYLRLDNVVLPDVRLLSGLMAMPTLEHLKLFALNGSRSPTP
jgi:hypothetical protein